MLLKEIISKDIKICTKETLSEEALQIIDTYKLTHIPIMESGNLLGNISEENLLEILPAEKIENISSHLEKFQLYEKSSIFETFKVFHLNDTNIIPILNDKEKIAGVVLMEEVISYFNKYSFFSEMGAILVLETPLQTYSISEIGKIVESNNAKFYGILVTNITSDHVQIVIKISAENITSIGETFERFGYTILNKLYKDKKHDLINERYEQLVKYMTI